MTNPNETFTETAPFHGYIYPDAKDRAEYRAEMPAWALKANDDDKRIAIKSLMSALNHSRSEV